MSGLSREAKMRGWRLARALDYDRGGAVIVRHGIVSIVPPTRGRRALGFVSPLPYI